MNYATCLILEFKRADSQVDESKIQIQNRRQTRNIRGVYAPPLEITISFNLLQPTREYHQLYWHVHMWAGYTSIVQLNYAIETMPYLCPVARGRVALIF